MSVIGDKAAEKTKFRRALLVAGATRVIATRACASRQHFATQPSRDMVKQIAEALDVPLHHQSGESFGRGLSEPRKRSGR